MVEITKKPNINLLRRELAQREKTPERVPLWKKSARSFTAGLGDVIKTAGHAANWLGGQLGSDRVGDWLVETGTNIIEEWEVPEEPKEFEWPDLLNPRWLATRIPRAIPFSLSLVPAAIIGGYASVKAVVPIAGALGLAKVGAFGKTLLGTLAGGVGATLTSRPLESALEAGGAYEQSLLRGETEEQARNVANQVFRENLTLAGMDTGQILLAFSPLGTKKRVGVGLTKRIAASTSKIAGVGTMEAGEEAFQDIIQRRAAGEEIAFDPRMKESAALGAVMGLGLGGAGSVYQTIINRTYRNLSPQQQEQIRRAKEGKTGVEAQRAELLELDKIAETPEGRMAIEKTTNEILALGREFDAEKGVPREPIVEPRPALEIAPEPPIRPVERVLPERRVERPPVERVPAIPKELEPLKTWLQKEVREGRIKSAEEFVEKELPKRFGLSVEESARLRGTHGQLQADNRIIVPKYLPKNFNRTEIITHEIGHSIHRKLSQTDIDVFNSLVRSFKQEIDKALPRIRVFEEKGGKQGYFETFADLYGKYVRGEKLPAGNQFKFYFDEVAPLKTSVSQLTDFYNQAVREVKPEVKSIDENIFAKEIEQNRRIEIEPRTAIGVGVKKDPAIIEIDNSPLLKTPTIKTTRKEAIGAFQDTRSKIEKARDTFLEHIQDEMIRVLRLVEDPQLKIDEKANPYDAERRFHGRVGSRIEDLKKKTETIEDSFIQTAKELNISKEELQADVFNYLISRHAPERNAALYDGAAGITTAEAKARLKEIEGKDHIKDIKQFAETIKELNDATLEVLLEGQVISQELYDTLKNKYKNHISLQRVMEHQDDFAGALARGFDVKGTGIRIAKGSKREIADVLGNVVFNYEQAIIRAEKNRVDLSTLKMVRDNKEVLRDLFRIRKPKVIGKTWDGKHIRETITDPQTLVLRENGEPILIDILDRELALALRGVGRHRLSGIMRGIGAITRFYSGLHTRYNPEFAFSNKVRDIQEALVYAAAQKEIGFKGAAKVAAREFRLENVKDVLDHLRGKDTPGARIYNEMRLEGGTTGGMGLSTRKQIEIDINDIRKERHNNPRKTAQRLLEYVDAWNTIFEDSSRLAVYKEALANGATKEKAAVLAKDSTVNFNKFGKQGQIINALYIFSNASIQGTTKMIRAMRNPKVAAVVSTIVFGSVAATAEWNDEIDPDWRDKIRTWDRLNSLTILLPNQDGTEGIHYISIPVSWGIKPIKVMADQMHDLMIGRGEGVINASKAVLSAAIESYNPAGGTNVVSAITPTILDIPIDVARNQAWHGGRIRPDWDENAPASIQYFKSLRDSATGKTSVGITKGLSGIGIEISPANIHYSYEQIIGGVGRFVSKSINTISALGGGQKPLPRDIPVVSRFYKSIPEEQIGSGTREFQQIAKMLEEQSRERFYLKQQAEDAISQLDNIHPATAREMFKELKEADPKLADEIVKIMEQKEKGLTFIDRKILDLGVMNHQRADFLIKKFAELKTDKERRALWDEYIKKGIITERVKKQLINYWEK